MGWATSQLIRLTQHALAIKTIGGPDLAKLAREHNKYSLSWHDSDQCNLVLAYVTGN